MCLAFPFWDHDVEPPLCAAVRLGNSPEIVRCLLEGRASVEHVNVLGRTPLEVLNDVRTGSLGSPSGYARDLVAANAITDLFLQAGATQLPPQVQPPPTPTVEALIGWPFAFPLDTMST